MFDEAIGPVNGATGATLSGLEMMLFQCLRLLSSFVYTALTLSVYSFVRFDFALHERSVQNTCKNPKDDDDERLRIDRIECGSREV